MADKYAPLHEYLVAAGRRGDNAVELALDQIATLVGGLPASARNHRAWWANGSHDHAAAWLDAGWAVAAVMQPSGSVRFERSGGFNRAVQAARVRQPTAGSESRAATRTRSAVTETSSLPLLETIDVRVTAEWRDAGPIGIDSKHNLVFPRLPRLPGLYRMTLSGARGDSKPRIYIGETDDLRRRVAHYRNPGPTQDTNLRLNARLKSHLGEGGGASIAIATRVTANLGQGSGAFELQLSRKASRLLGENAALVTAQLSDTADIENLG